MESSLNFTFPKQDLEKMKKSCESVLFLQLDADPAVCQTVFKLDDYDYVNMLVVYFQMVSIYCCNVKHIIQSSIVIKPSTAQVDYKQYLFFSIVHCEYERDLRSNEHHSDSSNILLSYTHSHLFATSWVYLEPV